MIRFQFTISHVPGKELIIADALSCAPVADPTPADRGLQEEANVFVNATMQSLPTTEERVEQIKDLQLRDPVCQQISVYCQSGWPDKDSLPDSIKPYFPVAAELAEINGLVMRGNRILIQPSLRRAMLAKIHGSHQGITKCRERARQSVLWPGIAREIDTMVRNCSECCKAQLQRAQPLIPTTLPQLPWQKVASDLFEWRQQTFLLIVDYYSRFIEIARLNGSTAEEVVTHTKSIFARHGIPETVVSDNGPQYTSELYAEFSKTY